MVRVTALEAAENLNRIFQHDGKLSDEHPVLGVCVLWLTMCGEIVLLTPIMRRRPEVLSRMHGDKDRHKGETEARNLVTIYRSTKLWILGQPSEWRSKLV